MGISIEQFRSRIRSHDNFVKIKDVSSRFKDRFWNIMVMTFYFNVFYLMTLKQVVIPYKMLNQVMFWFTQMMCYNFCIPLLIRQVNDLEENPGPTIFDIIDPMIIVSETTVKEMKHSLVKMLVSYVQQYHLLLLFFIK